MLTGCVGDGRCWVCRLRMARPTFALLRQLTRLRRNANDWLLVAQSEWAVGDEAAAVEALEAAVRINTWLPEVHRSLMQFYLQQGNLDRAAWHRARAVTP